MSASHLEFQHATRAVTALSKLMPNLSTGDHRAMQVLLDALNSDGYLEEHTVYADGASCYRVTFSDHSSIRVDLRDRTVKNLDPRCGRFLLGPGWGRPDRGPVMWLERCDDRIPGGGITLCLGSERRDMDAGEINSLTIYLGHPCGADGLRVAAWKPLELLRAAGSLANKVSLALDCLSDGVKSHGRDSLAAATCDRLQTELNDSRRTADHMGAAFHETRELALELAALVDRLPTELADRVATLRETLGEPVEDDAA